MGHLDDSEVGDFGMNRFCDEHVLRLEITVDEPTTASRDCALAY